MTNLKEEILSCRNIGGTPRYDLPAFFLTVVEDYLIYFRPRPAKVIHHKHNKIIKLDMPEVVLVNPQHNHVMSISFDDNNIPTGIYVNVNLKPIKNENGWSWEDLELDLKFSKSFNGSWSPILLDVDEYDLAVKDNLLSTLAESEIKKIMTNYSLNKFPFNRKQEGLGISNVNHELNKKTC